MTLVSSEEKLEFQEYDLVKVNVSTGILMRKPAEIHTCYYKWVQLLLNPRATCTCECLYVIDSSFQCDRHSGLILKKQSMFHRQLLWKIGIRQKERV